MLNLNLKFSDIANNSLSSLLVFLKYSPRVTQITLKNKMLRSNPSLALQSSQSRIKSLDLLVPATNSIDISSKIREKIVKNLHDDQNQSVARRLSFANSVPSVDPHKYDNTNNFMPLLPLQSRLYLHELFVGKSEFPIYNLYYSFIISNEGYDPSKIRYCIEKLVGRHPALLMAIQIVDDISYQYPYNGPLETILNDVFSQIYYLFYFGRLLNIMILSKFLINMKFWIIYYIILPKGLLD